MNKISSTLCLGLLMSSFLIAQKKEIGNLVVENIPDMQASVLGRLEQYQNVRSASFSSWDKENKGVFISTRFGDVNHIHYVANAGGYRQQITFGKEPINSISICPDKTQHGFAYTKDNGGDENFQVYFFDMNIAQERLLTDGKSRNVFQGWSDSGKKIAYMSNKRNGADLDLYIRDLAAGGNDKMVLELKGGGWGVASWTKDEKKMVLQNYKSVNESQLFLLDVASGKMEEINAHPKEPIAYSGATFTHDNKGFFITSDENTEFKNLRYYDIAAKTFKNLTTNINWDVESIKLSEDGKLLLFSVNEGGFSKLYKMDTKTMKFTPINGLPKGVLGGYSLTDDAKRIAFSINTPTSPSDVYVLDIAKGVSTRWTFSEIGGLNPKNFADAALIAYPSFDKENGKQRTIPAIIYRPKKKGKRPVVINIHGGPEGQSMPNFNPLSQFMVNELDIAVILPNVRGSTGYGKTYVKLDNGFQREDAVKDIGALLDWIKTQADLDADRVIVFGGSYGGYMSLACMTHFNDRLRGGIDLFGISNFRTFLKNTGAYRVDLRRVEYGDERDEKMAAFQEQISPLNNIQKITKPMLIYQGKNDPRVPLGESDQMVEGLKKQGTKVWYIMAKDEGHSLAKKANRDYTYAAIIRFLQENLLQ